MIFRTVTLWLFSVCLILFVWNEKETRDLQSGQGELALAVGLTPLQKALFFDYPEGMEAMEKVIVRYHIRSTADLSDLSAAGKKLWRRARAIPVWSGLFEEVISGGIENPPPMFEKIRAGEVWRLFTPSLLHKDFFHFIFNMSWLWLLGLQIEARIRKFRFCFLVVLLAVISNTAQYLTGGPYFLGFSGVIAGLTGFIWIRQRKAPQEKYPLPRSASLFVFYFILAMIAWETIGLIASFLFSFTLPLNIANTAHVIGGLFGILAGRLPFFAGRRM